VTLPTSKKWAPVMVTVVSSCEPIGLTESMRGNSGRKMHMHAKCVANRRVRVRLLVI